MAPLCQIRQLQLQNFTQPACKTLQLRSRRHKSSRLHKVGSDSGQYVGMHENTQPRVLQLLVLSFPSVRLHNNVQYIQQEQAEYLPIADWSMMPNEALDIKICTVATCWTKWVRCSILMVDMSLHIRLKLQQACVLVTAQMMKMNSLLSSHTSKSVHESHTFEPLYSAASGISSNSHNLYLDHLIRTE